MNGVDIRESSRARDTVHSPGFRHRRKRGATVAGWLLLLFATTSFTQGKPPILSASEAAYPPFCLVDAQNRADGFSVELLRAAIQAMGREADFRVGEWAEIKGWLERGEVQALPLVGRTPEREALFDFSVPYMTLYGAIVVRTDQTGIENLDDLRGKRVAVMKGDNAEEFLRREDRGVEIHTTPTFEQALRELAVGRHDAVVIQRLVALRLLAELRTDPLRVIPRPIEEFRQDFCFAVREGDSETLALINEGLALAIADGTYRRLHSKWFAALQLPSDRRIVVGGDHNFPPYEYLNARGEPEGFAVDLIRAISRETGLEIEIRLGPWARAVRALETGEVDLLQGIFYSEERSRKFDFTLPHASQHYVSVVRAGSGRAPESFEELRGHRLVAQEGDLIQAQLESHGLLDPLLLVETQEDVLRAVAEGRADYGLVMRLSALRLMDQGEWAKLVLGKTPVYSAEYCMAVTKGNSALLTQINEGLRLLQDSGEYRRIQEKWMGHLYEGPSFWRVAGTYLLWFAIPLLGVLLLVLLWIRLLRREVASRTRELRDREQLLSVAGQLARFGAWSVDLPADRVNWSDEVAEIHGVPAGTRPTIDEAISFYMPEDRDRILRAFNACAQEGVPYDEVLRIEPKSGPRIWIRTLGIAHRDSSGRIVRVAGAFQDISEPKKAAEALQASEAQYRHLIENIQEIIFTLNLQGEFSFVSPSWTPLLGHRVQDVQGQPFQIFVHPEDVSICESAFEIVTRTGVRRDGIIFRAKHMGGNWRWFNCGLVAVRDAEGKLEGVEGIGTDITELMEAEINYQTLFDKMLNGFALHEMIYDAGGKPADYRFLAVNPAFERMTGLTAKKVVGKSVLEILPGTEPHWIEAYGRVALTGEPVFFENHSETLGKHFEVTAFRPAPNRFACIFSDVTDRKQAQYRVEHLNRVLRAIRDVNQLIVRERDREAVIREGCRLMVSNRGYASSFIALTDAAGRVIQWTGSGLIEESASMRALLDRGELPPCCIRVESDSVGLVVEDRQKICGVCPLIEACGDTLSMCMRLAHADREYGYLVVAVEKAQSFDAEERDLLQEVAEDLGYALHNMETEAQQVEAERQQARLQEQLNQAQKMESVGRLAGGVAHDFNNLLMGILGYVELARDHLDPEHPVREYLDEVTRNANRSADLTRQLLAFARRQTVAPKVLDLNDTIASLLSLLRRLLGEDIDLAWMPGLGVAPVKIDPTQVDQILANLCVNARDAISGVGKLTIETDNVTIDAAYAEQHPEALCGEYVRLSVSDSGCGMSSETLLHVFEPFFTTKERDKGTGLGLATVYGIVKQNNGFVNVYSEPGQGSTFRIYLPRVLETPEPTASPVLRALPTGGTETVLLVEDEDAIRKIVGRYLSVLGYDVIPASNPDEALELIKDREAPIPLLITDVVMPGMSGRDLSLRLRERWPSMRTLFMSGYTANAIAHQGILDEGVDFLQKPVSMAALAGKMRDMLNADRADSH